jgi:microcystin-dependent protein
MAAPFIGEVRLLSFNFAPRGWATCDGQLLPINQNAALFSLLGTTYGGNGSTTFGLPDLRGRAPLHQSNGFQQGQRGGEESHVLSVAELAAHTHPVNTNSAAANNGAPLNNTWSAQSANAYGTTPNNQMNPATIQASGGGQAHPNLQPYLVINFCIALQGIFPSRN